MGVSLDSPVTHDLCAKHLRKLNNGGLLTEAEYLSCYEICYTVFDQFNQGFDDFHDNIINLYALMQDNQFEAQQIRIMFHNNETIGLLSPTVFLAVLTNSFLQYESSPENYQFVPVAEIFDVYRSLMPPVDSVEENINIEEFTQDLEKFKDLSSIYPEFPDGETFDTPPAETGYASSSVTPDSRSTEDNSKDRTLPNAPKIGASQPVNNNVNPDSSRGESGFKLPPPPVRRNTRLDHSNVVDEDSVDTDNLLREEPTEPLPTSVPNVGSVDTYQSNIFNDTTVNSSEVEEENPYKGANSFIVTENDNNVNDTGNNNNFDVTPTSGTAPDVNPSSETFKQTPPQNLVSTPEQPGGFDENIEKLSADDVDKIFNSPGMQAVKGFYEESGFIPDDATDNIMDLFDDESTQAIFNTLPDSENTLDKKQDSDNDSNNDTGNDDLKETVGDGSLLSQGVDALKEYWKAISGVTLVLIILIGLAIFAGGDGKKPEQILQTEIITTAPSPVKHKFAEQEISPISIPDADELSAICSDPYNSLNKDPNKPFICTRLIDFSYVNIVYKFAMQRVSKITIVTGDQTSRTYSRGINAWCAHFVATDFIIHVTDKIRIPFHIDVSLNSNPKLPKTVDLIDILNKDKDNPDYPNGIEVDKIEVSVVGSNLAGGCSTHNLKPASQGEPSGNFALEKITFFHRVPA